MTGAHATFLKIKHLLSTSHVDADSLADLCDQFAREATTPAERELAQKFARIRADHEAERRRIEAEYEVELTEMFHDAHDDIREWAEQTWPLGDEG